jgi:hypothetical protein
LVVCRTPAAIVEECPGDVFGQLSRRRRVARIVGTDEKKTPHAWLARNIVSFDDAGRVAPSDNAI